MQHFRPLAQKTGGDGTSIRVRDPYRDGAVVVQLLHESFGREAVQNIWLSPKPAFDKALVAALKTDYAALEQSWLDKQ